MHDGYFVGRKELTAWIQSSFNPAFQKVEDLANGVVYCQIINSVYPGALPMAKVKMDARTEVDCLHNFKLLQTAFNKKKVDRYIEVDKLTKGHDRRGLIMAGADKVMRDLRTIFKNSDEVLPALELAFESIWADICDEK